MGKDQNLLYRLNELTTEEEPLTAAEMEGLAQQVLRRAQTEQKSTGRTRHSRKWPVWGRMLAGVAACAVLLMGVNGINPAWAEELPVLGDVFAYINGLSKGHLRSEQLAEYAQQTQIQADSDSTQQAESDPEDTVQQDGVPDQPFQLTLSQIYCDELYLRLGLALTAEDDTLADYEAITIDPPLLWEDTSQEEANTLYGGVTLNGESVGGDLVPYFRKQDDHTFVCEMDYNLKDYTGTLEDMQASLTLSNLVGIKRTDGAVGSEEKIPMEGDYSLSFVVSADGTLAREGRIEGGEQNHLCLFSVKATPGETQTQYSVNGPLPNNATPALRLFAVQDGKVIKLEPAGGSIEEDDETSRTVYTDYFDAVPEGVTELQAQVLDKNAESEVILGEWSITLPQ